MIHAQSAADILLILGIDIGHECRPERERRLLPCRALVFEEEPPVDVGAIAARITRARELRACRAIVESFVAPEQEGRKRAPKRQRVPPIVRRVESVIPGDRVRLLEVRALERELDVRLEVGQTEPADGASGVAAAERLIDLRAGGESLDAIVAHEVSAPPYRRRWKMSGPEQERWLCA